MNVLLNPDWYRGRLVAVCGRTEDFPTPREPAFRSECDSCKEPIWISKRVWREHYANRRFSKICPQCGKILGFPSEEIRQAMRPEVI